MMQQLPLELGSPRLMQRLPLGTEGLSLMLKLPLGLGGLSLMMLLLLPIMPRRRRFMPPRLSGRSNASIFPASRVASGTAATIASSGTMDERMTACSRTRPSAFCLASFPGGVPARSFAP